MAAAQPTNIVSEDTRDPGRWMVFWSVTIAALATILDANLMGLIAPAVKQDLGLDSATINLISSISMLMLAAFILGGGTLGDIYGRKRILTIGLIGMCITSALAMVAPGATLLLPIRGAAGIMAALVQPMALAIITVTFDSIERPKAIGLYSASMGIIGGLGTIVVAFLNEQFGWRSTFGLVLLLAAVGLLMSRHYVKESKAGGDNKVDWLGIMLIAAGLFSIVFGINRAAAAGFASLQVLLPVGIGIVLLVILIYHCRRVEYPALQLSLFENKVFSVTALLGLIMGFAATGAFFQISTYLQSLQKVSPVQASLTLLPYTLSLFVFAILAGRWVGKFANRLLITVGLAAAALGLVAMAIFISPSAGFLVFLLPLILLGGGASTANTPRINALMGSAPDELAGSASATNNASYQLGGSFGIAVMGAVFGTAARNAYNSDLTAMGLDQATIQKSIDVLNAWLQNNSGDVASQFGITVQQLESVITEYQQAFTSGVSVVLWIGAALLIAGAVLAWFTLGTKSKEVSEPTASTETS